MPRLSPFLLAALACASALAGCIGGNGSAGSSVEFRDVHGLAIHPQDPDVVFVATHNGLFRGGPEGFERVGERRDDLMGFTMHPTDGNVMWSSGHPAPDSGQTGNLGLRRSTDGGATWQNLSMPSFDFHALAVSPADPTKMWAFSRGRTYASADAGATFQVVSDRGINPVALVAHPTEADTVFATTGDAAFRSVDGGRTWAPAFEQPSAGLAFSRDMRTILSAEGAGLSRSIDGGQTWADAPMPGLEGRLYHVALSASDPQKAWAASYDGAVFRSVDGGASWTQVKSSG